MGYPPWRPPAGKLSTMASTPLRSSSISLPDDANPHRRIPTHPSPPCMTHESVADCARLTTASGGHPSMERTQVLDLMSTLKPYSML